MTRWNRATANAGENFLVAEKDRLLHSQREMGNDGLSRARLTSVRTNEADIGLDVAMFDSKERSWTRQVGSISVISARESGIPFLAYWPWHDQFTSLSLPYFAKLRRSQFASSPPAFPLEHARTGVGFIPAPEGWVRQRGLGVCHHIIGVSNFGILVVARRQCREKGAAKSCLTAR